MMTTSQLPQDTANQHSAVIRALSSIMPQQADIIVQAAHASGRWSTQTIDDYDGYLSILIAPSITDDEQKTFFVSGTTQHLKLFETDDDNMTWLATFTDVNELSEQLLDLIGQKLTPAEPRPIEHS